MFGFALSLLAGCAPFQHTEAPLATNFATSKQPKLQAAHHWQVIADDMADTIAKSLAEGSPCVAAAGNCPAVFVARATPPTPFSQAFQTGFVSRLVNQGTKVAIAAPGDIHIAIDIQSVRFSPDRSQYLGVGKFSLMTLGLWGLHNLAEHSGYHHAAGVGALGVAVASDIVQWNMAELAKGPTPQMEVIVTASATRGGQFLARRTNVYYIADTDSALYTYTLPPKPPVAIRVVGEGGTGK